ncbi:MAG: DUF2779 domain-containing protein [Gammaproteobacteria bacterium]|nr:DUF2779 domain-containing protein [Gammaproteobacteria bacterium]
MTAKLSKSQIMSGLQCEKRLWLENHKPELEKISANTEHRFAEGREVHKAARSLQEAFETTFEAAFSYQDVLVKVDILKKDARGHVLTEVKSGASVKERYCRDCAVQAWVLEGCGLPVGRVELAHVDTGFVYGGDGDYRGLLHHEDVTSDIAEIKKQVPRWVSRFKTVLKQNEPDIKTGRHCNAPHPCPFIAHCSKSDAGYPVTDLPGGNAIAGQLRADGITDIRDIPPGRLQNAKQEWVRKVTVSGQPELKPAAKKAVDACSYPRYYLDFETIKFAVPIWKDTRPHQALPFQWSCHVECAPGEVGHHEFLDTTGDAPMRAFIDSLLAALGDSGAIFVYTSFEKTRLNELAGRFPDLQERIHRVIGRLVDLWPIAKKNYYHPDMRGSWSLKALLPIIAPHLNYSDLGEVQDGNAAGRAYLEMTCPDTKTSRAQSLANNLRTYCKRDTEALVAVVEFFSTEKST